MTVTTDRPATGINLSSPTRLANAPRLLVSAEQVQRQMQADGSRPGPVSIEDEGRFNAYAALLLCFTPKVTASVPDRETAPSHDDLLPRLEHLTGETLSYYEARAVGRLLGMEQPSMTVREARWLFNVCWHGRTKYWTELVARPREWTTLEQRLGIFVEFGQAYGRSGLEVVTIHRTDPRAGAAADLVRGPFDGKTLEFGGDWQAISAGAKSGFTGRSHRLALELMERLREYSYDWSPRLVRDTLELVIHGYRYTLVGTPGPESGKVRLRLDAALAPAS